ncbi:hypothetical protein [Siphonobacter sp. BAB-5405]|uniref:hypothetical protein n=1 Tax=Siphonobacter sp. BAB-5405 TaxID=1864825 RepID=UPI0011AF7129|nr:hypothetical protein [Siphonobacter sp. BAB-5405]
MILIIIIFFISILVIGSFTLRKSFVLLQEKLNFTLEYREQFVIFTNNFYKKYDSFERRGEIDHERYVWLTKNANKMQGMLGQTGLMEYIGPFRQYKISNYNIVLNTIPKFRDSTITDFDVNSVDDCLLRYIGIVEQLTKENFKQLKNPFIWLKQGFKEFFSLPIYIFNWFGIIPDSTVGKIKSNLIFNTLTGIGGLVTFVSGLVTIIQGKEQTLGFFKKLFY